MGEEIKLNTIPPATIGQESEQPGKYPFGGFESDTTNEGNPVLLLKRPWTLEAREKVLPISNNLSIQDGDGIVHLDVTTSTGTITVTLPDRAKNVGRRISIRKVDAAAGTAQFTAAGSDKIDGVTSKTMTTQYGILSVIAGSSEWESSTTGVADASVSQSKLKTSTEEYSITSSSGTVSQTFTVANAEYGFLLMRKRTGGTTYNTMVDWVTQGSPVPTTWNADLYMAVTYGSGTAVTLYGRIRYVTASGEVFWIFALRNKNTGVFDTMAFCPDHPCMGNGKPEDFPHPFRDVNYETHEVLCFNPNADQLQLMVDHIEENDSTYRGAFEALFDVDYCTEVDYPKIPVTIKIADRMGFLGLIDKFINHEKVPVNKAIIGKPTNVKCYTLKTKKI